VEKLSDELLLDAFKMAKKLKLDLDFMAILKEEIRIRKLNNDDFMDKV